MIATLAVLVHVVVWDWASAPLIVNTRVVPAEQCERSRATLHHLYDKGGQFAQDVRYFYAECVPVQQLPREDLPGAK